jgi:hypothetical protein
VGLTGRRRRELLLLEPGLVAQLADRAPESFLRSAHATTLASTSSLCW